jgi:hypothetical protein
MRSGVVLDGGVGQDQLCGYLGVGQSLGQFHEDVAFAVGQRR